MTSAMRPFTSTIPLDEARRILAAAIRPIDATEVVPLLDANGRVLSSDVVSTVDVPPFARAGMDGYAVRAEDTAGASRSAPVLLHCIEKVFTGQVPLQAVGRSQCTEVATGAPMPPGADAVVMVEETAPGEEGAVRILSAAAAGQNVGRQGADILRGQAVLRSGELLTPSRIGAAAAIGMATVSVFKRPRVAILSTGNEIIEPGAPLGPGQIYDINKFTLATIVTQHGAVPVPYRAPSDSLDDLLRAVEECRTDDVLVFSGGSSVGERDLVLDVIAARGEVLFHGVAMKPGKPTALGRIDGKLVFALPGYPTSCLTNAYVLLVPALRHMARLPPLATERRSMPLGRRIASTPGRHQFYTVRIEHGVAMPAFKASGDITSMSQADGYIEIAAAVDAVEPGTVVDVHLF